MNFYTSIADNYEQIFPLNSTQLEFVKSALPANQRENLLDIGCGTGSLSIALSAHFGNITAIDLDSEMIARAMEKKSEKVNFQEMDMLKIQDVFPANHFDSILCFGNTLVHLDGLDPIHEFLEHSLGALKKGGKLLFQIIHYDHVLASELTGLPTIENENIRFERNYDYNSDLHRIDFETILTIKENRKEIRNCIPLYPLQRKEIDEMLSVLGYSNWNYFGNFKKESLNEKSLPLVVEVIK